MDSLSTRCRKEHPPLDSVPTRTVRWLDYDVAEIVTRTTRQQGLPTNLRDRAALAKIAALLATATTRERGE